VRLARLGAAVGIVLAIPGLIWAGDPRLVFHVQPPVGVIVENGGRRDALLTIDVHNPGDRKVRVERARLTYLEGDAVIATVDAATSIFLPAGLLSDPRIEPGRDEAWTGLCLAPPSSGIDRARFELELTERRGLRVAKATQVLDIPLHPPIVPPVIALPVAGTWRVSQAHACESNHRRGRLGGEFAWDLVAVNEAGRSGGPGFEASHRNDDSATFGRPVLSPVAGTVVFVADGVDDNDAQKEFPRRSVVESARAPRWIFGNHVVLDAGHGVFVLLAHLEKDSIAVRPGAVVREGDVLARAGNSGNTMLPHVHVQVMDGADPADPGVSGIPAQFRDYVEVTAIGDGPQSEAVFRRVAAGDPPEGAVVQTFEATRHLP
jgi:hypothetical protein